MTGADQQAQVTLTCSKRGQDDRGADQQPQVTRCADDPQTSQSLGQHEQKEYGDGEREHHAQIRLCPDLAPRGPLWSSGC